MSVYDQLASIQLADDHLRLNCWVHQLNGPVELVTGQGLPSIQPRELGT